MDFVEEPSVLAPALGICGDVSEADSWLFASCGEDGRRERNELRQLSEVLGGGGQQELISGSTRPTQAQSIQPEDALQMSEEHLDLLSFSTRDGVGLGLGDRAGLVTSGFMNGSRNLACKHIRTALGFEHAGVAVVLSGAIADRAVPRDPLARRGERTAIFPQLFAPGADIEVAFGIECEVAAGESSVRAPGFVDQVQ